MLRNLQRMFGGTVAVVGLVATLAVAQTPTQTPPQGQPQHMTCSKDDGKGDCVAAMTADGKEIVVVGEGLKRGEAMTCVNTGNVVNCKPVTK